MLAGHRLVRVHGLGGLRGSRDGGHVRGEGKTPGLPERPSLRQVAGSWPNLVWMHVLSVQKDSAGNAAVDLVQLEHLSGLLSTDPAVQEHAFMWRVSHTDLGTGYAPELEELGSGVLAVETEPARDGQSPRGTYRRAARRRPEETEPGENGVGVILAESVQKVERPVCT